MKTPLTFILFFLFSSTVSLGDSPGHGGQDRPHRPRPRAVQEYFKQLQEKDPEEMNRLQQLRKSDPEAFREELRERVRRKQGSSSPQRDQHRAAMEEYAEAIRNTGSPEERQQVIDRITEDISQRFDSGLSMREEAIDRLRQRLSKLEERHEFEKQNRDQIIDHQVLKIIKAADTESEQPDS